ncbi:MAG TPA: DUF4340 domain-containing protein, partial [Gemmataceae bacterium]|nr:DUF4340 domain-containing protein [Gemmataceae bacterium]
MNFKTTYLFFGILGAVVVALVLVVALNPPKAIDQTYLFPSLHDPRDPVAAKDIDGVTITRTEPRAEKIVFARDKDDGRWRMTEPFALREYRVDRNAVDRLVDEVMDAKRDEHAQAGSDLKQYGLDNPAVVVTIEKGGKKWTVSLGKKFETTGKQTGVVYALSSEQPKQALEVKLSQLDAAYKEANDFRDKQLLADSPSDIQSVSLQDGKHET